MSYVTDTLTEAQDLKLQDAQNKLTIDTLNSLEYGDEIKLNDIFKVYHYCEEDIVVIGFINDDIEDWEVLQVQWDTETSLIEYEAL